MSPDHKGCTNCGHIDAGKEVCDPCEFYPRENGRPPTRWVAMQGPDTSVGDALQADRRRLEWLIPVIDDSDAAGGPRTMALGAALMVGKTGRDAIDYAMEGCPK